MFLSNISVALMLIVLAFLSKKLGEALDMPPYYRLYYCVIGVQIVWAVLQASLPHVVLEVSESGFASPWPSAIFAAAITMCLAVAWRYWGWLISALFSSRDGGGA